MQFFYNQILIIFLDGNEQNAVLLSDDIKERIQISLSVYSEAIRQLTSGTISLPKLGHLIGKEENVLRVQKTMRDVESNDSQNNSQYEILEHVISSRKKELEAFQHQRYTLVGFVNICQDLNAGLVSVTLNILIIMYTNGNTVHCIYISITSMQ